MNPKGIREKNAEVWLLCLPTAGCDDSKRKRNKEVLETIETLTIVG